RSPSAPSRSSAARWKTVTSNASKNRAGKTRRLFGNRFRALPAHPTLPALRQRAPALLSGGVHLHHPDHVSVRILDISEPADGRDGHSRHRYFGAVRHGGRERLVQIRHVDGVDARLPGIVTGKHPAVDA